MLDSFRSTAGSLWAKILLAFLVLTFAIWGIGDMVRRPNNNMTVATVGDVTITSSEFMHSMHRETERLRSMMGEHYSPDIVKDINLARFVLQKLVDNTLMKQESEALGLVPSDADVVRKIRSNPAFQDNKGNFDKGIFEAMLQNMNVSEKAYVDQLRRDMAIGLLIDTLTAVTPVSDMAARTLLQTREEERRITLYRLNSSMVNTTPQPDDAKIKAYYDTHKQEFTAPEYRNLSYVTLTNADVPKDIAISEDALKAAYQERIDEFKHPERRTVEQLLYASEDKAKKASSMLKDGTGFAQVAKTTDILNKNSVSMGKIERSNVLENAADTVFSLKVNESSAPIQSPFGWHIFHVTAIDIPSVTPFNEARPALEKDIKEHGADEGLNKLANKLEDALAGGNTLKEATHDLNLKIVPIAPVNHQGESPDGTKPKNLPVFDKFLDTAFKTDEKTESPVVASKGGIFYIVRVDSIVPERLRSLDEVRGLAVTGWQKEERAKNLAALAKDIATKFIASPAERNAIIAKYALPGVSSPVIKHSSQTADGLSLPPMLVADVFDHPPQHGTDAYMLENGDYIIAVVDSIIPAASPDKNPKLAGALADIHRRLEASTQNEILEQYAEYLAHKYPVSINDSILQSLIGSSQ